MAGEVVTYDELAVSDQRAARAACCGATAATPGVLTRELARGPPLQRRRRVRVHLPGDPALPPPVVLGLVLSRDRLAPLRPGPRPRRAPHADPRRPARRLHPPHRVLGPPGVLAPRAVLWHPHRVRLHRRPRRSRRRCSRWRGSSSPQASADDSRVCHARALPQLRLHYEWLARRARHRRRRPADDHSTPTSPGSTTRPSTTRCSAGCVTTAPGYLWLIERYRRLGYDAAEIVERYDEHVEDVLVNVFYALSLRALARLDAEHGERCTAARARADRSGAAGALLRRARPGLFYDLAGRDERPVAGVDVVLAGAAGAAGASRRRSAAGSSRSSCWTRAATAAPCGIPSVLDGGADVQPGLRDVALLARARVDEHGVAAGAGDARARLRARRPSGSSTRSARAADAQRLPRVLQPAHRPRDWPRAASVSRRCCRSPRNFRDCDAGNRPRRPR